MDVVDGSYIPDDLSSSMPPTDKDDNSSRRSDEAQVTLLDQDTYQQYHRRPEYHPVSPDPVQPPTSPIQNHMEQEALQNHPQPMQHVTHVKKTLRRARSFAQERVTRATSPEDRSRHSSVPEDARDGEAENGISGEE